MEIEKPIKKSSLENFRKNLPIFHYRSDLIQKVKEKQKKFKRLLQLFKLFS